MANFLIAFALTMGEEGGIANHPSDKGGLTYKGITYRDHPNWGGWVAVNNARRQSGDTNVINRILASNAILQADVQAVYKREYWDVNRLDQISSQAIANEMFDTGVNCGVGTAAMFLQRSLNAANKVHQLYPNIAVDGNIGPVTLNLTNTHPYPGLLLTMLNVLQGARYIKLIEDDESQEVFARSWFGRVKFAA